MPAHGAERIREELRRCREAVEASGETFSTVDGAMLMRPPYGRRRPGTLRTMRARGLRPRHVVDHRLRLARAHDRARDHPPLPSARGRATSSSCTTAPTPSPPADRHKSIETVQNLLEHFGPQGYAFVTVPELVAAGR